MTGTVQIFCAGNLVFIIIGNFVCQIYVASKVFEGAQVIRGIVRGTRTFIIGWKRADELGIKPVMIFWSIFLSALLLIVFIIIVIVLIYGSQGNF